VNDVQVNLLGLVIAVVSVVSSGMQQIMCGTMQRKHQLSSHQLLSNTAYIQVCAAGKTLAAASFMKAAAAKQMQQQLQESRGSINCCTAHAVTASASR
jgi:solute carrier family 35 protein E3